MSSFTDRALGLHAYYAEREKVWSLWEGAALTACACVLMLAGAWRLVMG